MGVKCFNRVVGGETSVRSSCVDDNVFNYTIENNLFKGKDISTILLKEKLPKIPLS